MAEYLIDTEAGRRIADRMLMDGNVHIPHLASIETASVLRGWVFGGQLEAWEAERALVDLADLSVERHAHEIYLVRVWELRNNLSAYDAVYVALAEALGATVLTCDARLSRAPLAEVTIEVVDLSS